MSVLKQNNLTSVAIYVNEEVRRSVNNLPDDITCSLDNVTTTYFYTCLAGLGITLC